MSDIDQDQGNYRDWVAEFRNAGNNESAFLSLTKEYLQELVPDVDPVEISGMIFKDGRRFQKMFVDKVAEVHRRHSQAIHDEIEESLEDMIERAFIEGGS